MSNSLARGVGTFESYTVSYFLLLLDIYMYMNAVGDALLYVAAGADPEGGGGGGLNRTCPPPPSQDAKNE